MLAVRITLFALLLSGGCIAQQAKLITRGDALPINSSFDVSTDAAREAFAAMIAQPKKQPRPLLIIGGFLDVSMVMPASAHRLRSVFTDTPIITVSVTTAQSFAECRRRVLDAINQACPSNDSSHSVDVDVVGLSLGGLIARDAAGPSTDPLDHRQLTIHRLFTVGSPHTGAILAQRISLIQFHRDMRPNSAFIDRVNAQPRNYELYCYTHLKDDVVGEQHAAPPGMTPWWLADTSLFGHHRASLLDDRILADIARRLRDEPPLSHSPPTTLPAD